MSNGEHDLRQHLRQARSELEQGLRAWKNIRAEQVFAKYPELEADSDSALEIIYSTEFTCRELRGEEPTPEEYYTRFPQHRQRLQELFQLQETVDGGEADQDRPDRLDLPVEEGTDWGVEHFQVLDGLGQHGPVVVLKARQLSRDRLVAVKMLSKEQTPPEELDRFRRGRDDQARLRHPNIVQVYDRGEDEDDVFFTMEFGAAGTLAQRIGGRPLPADEAASILHALAGAVQYAHDRKIVHRDLKPANVVLTADGTPKVTDFGLAKRLETESGPTRSGQLLGTPPYMAPEQIDGREATREKTDVYGLGAVLYEMLTGRPPFQGVNELDTLIQVQRCRLTRPWRYNPSVDRELESICLRCLERRPGRRYPSAGALTEDLERWQGRRRPRAHGIPARASRAVRRHPFSTTLLLAALIAVCLPPIRYLTSQEWARKSALARLAGGEPVPVVAATGPPDFYRVVLPYRDEILGRSDDGTFVFGSETMGLLELFPDPQHEHYLFSAEVRRENIMAANGDVGVYLLYSSHEQAGQPLKSHWYCAVSFNDSPEANKGWVSLRSEHHYQPSIQRHTRSPGESIPYPKRPDKVWHKLAVEVSGVEVRVEWDGRPTTVSLRELDDAEAYLLSELKREQRPPLSLRSPLGLYAYRGSASFRNVVLKPIQPAAGQ
jgi:serine/threonine-protein kinase